MIFYLNVPLEVTEGWRRVAADKARRQASGSVVAAVGLPKSLPPAAHTCPPLPTRLLSDLDKVLFIMNVQAGAVNMR